MKNKKTLAVMLAAIMSLSATACGNSDSSSSAAEKKNDKTESKSETVDTGNYKGKIDAKGATLVVYTNRSDRITDGTYKKLTEQFEKANNCKVEYKNEKDYEGDMGEKITSGGDYGDVLAIPGAINTKNMSEYLEPLGTYEQLSKRYRWVDQKMTDDGTVYGLATGGSVTGLLYNKKVWTNAGYTEELDNLPKTPEEFIKALKAVKQKNTDCCPLRTDFGESWLAGKWNDWVLSASGDPSYNQNIVKNKEDIFGKDSYYYKVYKCMFDVFSDKSLIETNPMETGVWERSKTAIAEGKVGCMVLGSWAVTQIEELAGDNKDDIGFMPVPFTAPDGKQYSQTTPDYFLGVNKNSNKKELAKAYITWFIENSGAPENEGMLSSALGKPLPDSISTWGNKIVFFDEAEATEGYDGVFAEINSQSIQTDNNEKESFKMRMAKAAFDGKGEEDFQAICDEMNQKWNEARDKVLKEKGLA